MTAAAYSSKESTSLPKREILELSNALGRLSSNAEVLTQCCTALTRRTRQLTSLTTPASETSAALIQAASNVASTITRLKEARDKFDNVAKGESAMVKLYVGAKDYYDVTLKGINTGTVDVTGAASTIGTHAIPTTNKDTETRAKSRNIQRAIMFSIKADKNTSTDTREANTLNEQPANGPITPHVFHNQSNNDDDDIHITEQDVYAAADALELLKDTYSYFAEKKDDHSFHTNTLNINPFQDKDMVLDRRRWKSTASTLRNIEHAHGRGVEGMCLLIKAHLLKAGPAIRMKRALVARGDVTITTLPVKGMDATKNTSNSSMMQVPYESAAEARMRFNTAVQNRDLMKSVGEYEEYLPLTTRMVRELRAIFECLGEKKNFWGCALGDNATDELTALVQANMKKKRGMNEVTRTEPVGSGAYSNLCMQSLRTGFPHLDAYAETRKIISRQSMEYFHNTVKNEQTKPPAFLTSSGGELDASARDVVRCLEHALVVAAGEKSVYRCIVAPTSSNAHDESRVPPELKQSFSIAYAHVVAPVVDRILDIVEYFCDNNARLNTQNPTLESVRFAASAVAGTFRILDGVRSLVPTLTKLCEVTSDKQSQISGGGENDALAQNSVASFLCMKLHKTTVKYAARALEGIVKSVSEGVQVHPSKITLGVAPISVDVVAAIRLLCPYVSAYNSVSKRTSLPWDPRTGDDAKDIDAFMKTLIMKLLGTLQTDASNLKKIAEGEAAVNIDKSYLELKANLYLMNNSYYVLNQLGPSTEVKDKGKKRLPRLVADKEIDGDDFKIESDWFTEVVGNVFSSALQSYLSQWESLKNHLTSIDERSLEYQGGSNLLSLESGRILKSRFSGFNDEFERLHNRHKGLMVEDGLKEPLTTDIRKAFYGTYKKFFDNYSKVQFSKKNMDEYLKYPPQKISQMLDSLFSTN